MTLYQDDGDVQLYHGDCIDVLRGLPAGIAQTCITSPPYWGLRDYNAPGQLGLEATPAEYVERIVSVFREVRRCLRDDGTLWLNLAASFMSGDGARLDAQQNDKPYTAPQDSSDPDSACHDLCGECAAALSHHTERSSQPRHGSSSQPTPTIRGSEPQGSARASLGASPLDAQESTTQRSAPPPPGECSHCSNCGACLAVLGSSARDARLCARMAANTNGTSPIELDGHSRGMDAEGTAWLKYISGKLKPKDQAPIPWMVVMAMIADGWYFRGDIVWSKNNPMPESVTDRPTRAHEFLFLFSKQPRYFYDADAIREPGSINQPYGALTRQKDVDGTEDGRGNRFDSYRDPEAGRNRRSVWVIPTEPFPEAHFATYPQALVAPCILAGTSERGGCGECGAQWKRQTTTEYDWYREPKDRNFRETSGYMGKQGHARKQVDTTGWAPVCNCDKPAIPQLVLDPFIGSGTTCLVARKHGRRCIGIDLSQDYLKIAADRTRQLSLLGTTPEPGPTLERQRGLTGGAYSPPVQAPHSNARKGNG